ncbi:hypothetical protein SKAU_G00159270 [Synaphobranchus kaupii]|uniref:Uncharacterized protein n=1 Tax=Synaphobranchus kaupii TaxID=118154 RepID=A0A9Q1IZQ2_SYNKA|nr:hypothetical protein SKAU_G00159270 [Synaphobranchus kaupii]
MLCVSDVWAETQVSRHHSLSSPHVNIQVKPPAALADSPALEWKPWCAGACVRLCASLPVEINVRGRMSALRISGNVSRGGEQSSHSFLALLHRAFHILITHEPPGRPYLAMRYRTGLAVCGKAVSQPPVKNGMQGLSLFDIIQFLLHAPEGTRVLNEVSREGLGPASPDLLIWTVKWAAHLPWRASRRPCLVKGTSRPGSPEPLPPPLSRPPLGLFAGHERSRLSDTCRFARLSSIARPRENASVTGRAASQP